MVYVVLLTAGEAPSRSGPGEPARARHPAARPRSSTPSRPSRPAAPVVYLGAAGGEVIDCEDEVAASLDRADRARGPDPAGRAVAPRRSSRPRRRRPRRGGGGAPYRRPAGGVPDPRLAGPLPRPRAVAGDAPARPRPRRRGRAKERAIAAHAQPGVPGRHRARAAGAAGRRPRPLRRRRGALRGPRGPRRRHADPTRRPNAELFDRTGIQMTHARQGMSLPGISLCRGSEPGQPAAYPSISASSGALTASSANDARTAGPGQVGDAGLVEVRAARRRSRTRG